MPCKPHLGRIFTAMDRSEIPLSRHDVIGSARHDRVLPAATAAIGAPDLLCAPYRLVRELSLCKRAHDTSDRLLLTSQPPDLDAHRLRTRTASKQQPCLPSTAHVMNHVVRRLRPSQRMRMAASLTPRGPLLMNGSQPTDLHAVAAARRWLVAPMAR